MRRTHTAADMCEKVIPLLPFYDEGTLDRRDTAYVRAHLSGCATCRDALYRQKELSKLIAESAVPVPSALHEDIMRAVREDPRKATVVRSFPRRWIAVLSACCFVLLMAAFLPRAMTFGGKASAPMSSSKENMETIRDEINDSKSYGYAQELTLYRAPTGTNTEEKSDLPMAPADPDAVGQSPADVLLTCQGEWCTADGNVRLILDQSESKARLLLSGIEEQVTVYRDNEGHLTLVFASGESWIFTVIQNADGTLTLQRQEVQGVRSEKPARQEGESDSR